MALPKYVEIKTGVEALLLQYFEQVAKEELGPFKDVRRFIQQEGGTLKHNTLDNTGKTRETTYKEARIEYDLKNEDIVNMSFEDVRTLVASKAKEFGAQQAKYNYEILHEVTEETGNVVNANQQPLSLDLFLETISKITISFDKDGNPEMPTMVINPAQEKGLKKMLDDAENDEDAKRRLKAILADKKKEYDAEQARRKLVD